jgi:hypothetical protein
MKDQISGRYFLTRVSLERAEPDVWPQKSDRVVVRLQGAVCVGGKNNEAPLNVELTSEGITAYCAALYNAFAEDIKYGDRCGPANAPEYEIIIRKKQGSKAP